MSLRNKAYFLEKKFWLRIHRNAVILKVQIYKIIYKVRYSPKNGNRNVSLSLL